MILRHLSGESSVIEGEKMEVKDFFFWEIIRNDFMIPRLFGWRKLCYWRRENESESKEL